MKSHSYINKLLVILVGKMKLYKSITIALLITFHGYCQDTINYNGFLILDKTGKKMNLLYYQSITLYPDGTATWRWEYDLYSEFYGAFSVDGDRLTIDLYPVDERASHTDLRALNPIATHQYLMKGDGLYMLDEKGKIINRIKDRSLKRWPWHLRYIFKKEKRLSI